MKQYKTRTVRVLACLLAIICTVGCLTALSGCRTRDEESLKIAVLREDETSGEAEAWEDYLETMADELGFSVDFTTTKSADDEQNAIRKYGKKGYDAVMLFSDDDTVSAVECATEEGMYVVCPSGHPTDEQYETLKNMEFYLGSVGPDRDTEFAAGYSIAKFFVEELSQSTFTLYGGAASQGVPMHAERLCGMLVYLCEDGATDYDGAKTREALLQKLGNTSFDVTKFHSQKYAVTGALEGFTFDNAFADSLSASMSVGGTCILAVGAGDRLTKLADRAIKDDDEHSHFLVGGVDAITEDYAECFDLGYAYDCGKYPSSLAPALILILRATNGSKLLDGKGMAPRLGMKYWVATSKASLNHMLTADNEADGYCYNKPVIEHYLEADYSELVVLTSAEFADAVTIHEMYNNTQ